MKTRFAGSHYSEPGNDGLPLRPIRTFPAEDSPFLMALLARIVSQEQRVVIVGSASDGCKAVCNGPSLQPDLVITDSLLVDTEEQPWP